MSRTAIAIMVENFQKKPLVKELVKELAQKLARDQRFKGLTVEEARTLAGQKAIDLLFDSAVVLVADLASEKNELIKEFARELLKGKYENFLIAQILREINFRVPKTGTFVSLICFEFLFWSYWKISELKIGTNSLK